jgi:glycosyltransferase involved in cell wall biosynthesis
VVLAHSESAKNRIAELTGIEASKIRVIPHGDLTAALPVIPPREEARAILGLKNSEKYALVFGRVAPYKGIESFIDCWIRHKPQVVLLIVGPPIDPGYAQALVDHAGYDSNKIKLQLRDLSDSELALFLGAADCALFNYPETLTSGSAALARAAGLPVLLPERLSTVDLGEPCERVLRFAELNDQFLDLVEHAVALSSDFASAADWRYATRWSFVARQTGKAYRLAIEQV